MSRDPRSALKRSMPALLAVSILGFSSASSAVVASRPNILFVLTDDVGWGDIRAYNPNGLVELPAIERLAREGIRFTDAHTSAAKCAPSRYSIMTGNYQWRGKADWGQWNYKGGSQIRAGQESLGDVLRRAGYVTAIVGKYHLGAQFYKKNSTQFASSSDLDTSVDFARAMADGPVQHGFDYSFLAMRGIQEGPYAFFENGLLSGNPADLITWKVGDYGDTRIQFAGIGLPNWVTRDVGPTLTSQALDFIDAHQRAQALSAEPKPFFLFLNTEAVHDPRKPPVSIGNRTILGTSVIGARGDMLVEIDAIVERLVTDLEQRGLLQETLIVFSSDNGGQRLIGEENKGHFAVGGFRGDKGTIYEGGHRVPLIVKWGQQAFGSSPLPAGSASDALVGIQDLFATLAEMTGVPLAGDQGRDSVSLLPVLMGEKAATRDQMVQEADAPEDNAPDGIAGRHFAYRSENWKLVLNGSRSPVGLYNLAQDPFETTNLVAQSDQSDRVVAMKMGLENALVSERTAPMVIIAGPISAPSVVGLTQVVATTTITNAGLVVGTVTPQSNATVAAGDVIGQSPTAGTSVAAGSAVDLVVSTGVASAPNYTLSPTSLTFGSQALNLKSSAKAIALISIGTEALPIVSIAKSGTNPGQFAQTNNCGSSVPSGGTCTIEVTFKPTSTGSKTASVIVTAGGGAVAKAVSLSGTGVTAVTPVFAVSPSTLAFGNVARNVTSATKTVKISNTGTVVLPITSVTLGGTNPGQFSQTNSCPAQVPVGGSCSASVKFKPTSTGLKSATLKVTPGGGASAKLVALTGTGI